jgi:phytol kinase
MAKNGKMDSKLSRKIIHTGSAPLYLALLPLFSDQPSANFLAASIPFSQLVRLLLAYRSNQNAGIISAISRLNE